jgi:hypothetical protein
MLYELVHRLDTLPARRTTWNADAASALRYRWRHVDESGKIVTANLLLEHTEQF